MSNDIKSTAISWSVVQSPTVQSNEISTNTITLNSVDGSSNTTISSEGIITPNLTTFSINNNDLTFNDTEIVIGDKILTFDGEDEIIPANSVTDEARVFARVAQESATVAEASMETAVASASAASISEANAAKSATSAESNAALLGDAALKSGNNTFTGKNTYTGAINLTGGTLNGMQGGAVGNVLHSMLGASQSMPIEVMAELIPDSDTMEVWPNLPLPCAGSRLSNDGLKEMNNPKCFPNLKRIYATLSNYNSYGLHINSPTKRLLDESFIYISASTKFHCIYTGAKKVTFFAPTYNYTSSPSENMFPWAPYPYADKIEEVVYYAPKCQGQLRIDNWNPSVKLSILKDLKVLGDNVFTKVDFKEHFVTGQLTTKAGFPKATHINMPAAKLNKESLMPILTNLLPYDSTAMKSTPQLTIGIDPTLNGDEEINAALLLAQAPVEEGGKGWSVAVSGFTINSDANAATLGLRKPIYIKRWEDSDGGHIDENGTRWSIRYGNSVLHNWQANEQLGYEEFASLEDALTTWGLTEYIEIPNEEQINNN